VYPIVATSRTRGMMRDRNDPANSGEAQQRVRESQITGDVSRYHFVPREESLSHRTRVSTTTTTGIERETSRCVRRRSLTRECEYCARLRDRVRRPLPPQRSTEIAERGRAARDPPTEPRPLHSLRSPCSEQVQRGAVVASGVASRRATR